jgi:hypothetical protein
VFLPQDDVELTFPAAVELAEPAVLVAVGMGLAVLLPEKLKGDVLVAVELAVERGEVRQGQRGSLDAGRFGREQKALNGLVGQLRRKGPGESGDKLPVRAGPYPSEAEFRQIPVHPEQHGARIGGRNEPALLAEVKEVLVRSATVAGVADEVAREAAQQEIIRRYYDWTGARLQRLDSLMVSAAAANRDRKRGPGEKKPAAREPAFDPWARTAGILVSGFNGTGIHTLLGVRRQFDPLYRNFLFIEQGEELAREARRSRCVRARWTTGGPSTVSSSRTMRRPTCLPGRALCSPSGRSSCSPGRPRSPFSAGRSPTS